MSIRVGRENEASGDDDVMDISGEIPYSADIIPPDILSDFFCAHELSTTPPLTDALHILTNAFESLPGAFAIDNTPLTLRIGTTSTTLTPYAFATRTSLPFAAFTTPLQRAMDRARYSHRRRSPATDSNPVHPSDIALLLALAQEQQAALPRRKSYTVHVLAPDETARWICGVSADVGSEYLLALKEPWRDMGALDVRAWEVGIEGLAEEVGAVVWALGQGAVRVKRRKRGRGGGGVGVGEVGAEV
ncbi:hypothetical protein Q9L58_010295 [Maublancomyces gigas]|uniref:Uncharacterized protein n=1 Tax=Discina gigas TaxID=1032678 RepID=A0ABR3G4H6_9PEZI